MLAGIDPRKLKAKTEVYLAHLCHEYKKQHRAVLLGLAKEWLNLDAGPGEETFAQGFREFSRKESL